MSTTRFSGGGGFLHLLGDARTPAPVLPPVPCGFAPGAADPVSPTATTSSAPSASHSTPGASSGSPPSPTPAHTTYTPQETDASSSSSGMNGTGRPSYSGNYDPFKSSAFDGAPVAPPMLVAPLPPDIKSAASAGLNVAAREFRPEGTIGGWNTMRRPQGGETDASPAGNFNVTSGGPAGPSYVGPADIALRTQKAREELTRQARANQAADSDDKKKNLDDSDDELLDDSVSKQSRQTLRVNVDDFFQADSAPDRRQRDHGLLCDVNLQGVRAGLPPPPTLSWSRATTGKLLPPILEVVNGHVDPMLGEIDASRAHRPTHPAFRHVEVSMLYYSTFNHPSKAYNGRLERPPDLKLGGVLGDVPAIVIANIVMKLTGIPLAGVDMFSRNYGRCNLWLENPEQKLDMMQKLERRFWMAPVEHNYCIAVNDKDGEEYLLWYLEGLRLNGPKKVFFPRHLVTCDAWIELEESERPAPPPRPRNTFPNQFGGMMYPNQHHHNHHNHHHGQAMTMAAAVPGVLANQPPPVQFLSTHAQEMRSMMGGYGGGYGRGRGRGAYGGGFVPNQMYGGAYY